MRVFESRRNTLLAALAFTLAVAACEAAGAWTGKEASAFAQGPCGRLRGDTAIGYRLGIAHEQFLLVRPLPTHGQEVQVTPFLRRDGIWVPATRESYACEAGWEGHRLSITGSPEGAFVELMLFASRDGGTRELPLTLERHATLEVAVPQP